MSVAENIAITTGYSKTGMGMISWKETNQCAVKLLNRMNSHINPESRVQVLSAAEKSIVAISRALAQKADILILDEPTATLPQDDVNKLFDVINMLRAEGIAIVFVTHRLDEVFQIADRVTVMRNGRLITSEKVGDTSPSKLVLDIVGSEVTNVKMTDQEKPIDECVLSIKELLTGFVGPVSIDLYKGEVLSLFGLRGAGHHEVGRCIWGVEKKDAGKVFLKGEEFKTGTPEKALRKKIGFISSKRHEESMAASFSVRENIYINPAMKDGKMFRFMNINDEMKRCQEVINRFSIRPKDGERTIGTLSGGNQQKTIVARWFEADSDIMIFEEPTIGVDVGAKAEIYMLMKEGLKKGKSILLISSDIEEVTRLSHRVIVFKKGRVVGEISREEISGSRLSGLATGAVNEKGEDCYVG